jgi:hypothetical protein
VLRYPLTISKTSLIMPVGEVLAPRRRVLIVNTRRVQAVPLVAVHYSETPQHFEKIIITTVIFSLNFTLFLNFVLLFGNCWSSEFLLDTSETMLCLMSAPQVKMVPLLEVHQLLMLFAGTLTYLEPNLFPLIIFYKGTCIILKH